MDFPENFILVLSVMIQFNIDISGRKGRSSSRK